MKLAQKFKWDQLLLKRLGLASDVLICSLFLLIVVFGIGWAKEALFNFAVLRMVLLVSTFFAASSCHLEVEAHCNARLSSLISENAEVQQKARLPQFTNVLGLAADLLVVIALADIASGKFSLFYSLRIVFNQVVIEQSIRRLIALQANCDAYQVSQISIGKQLPDDVSARIVAEADEYVKL